MKDSNSLYLQDYNSLDTDYKTEVIAYQIWKYYPDVDGVFLKRLGSNNRSFHKDLRRIKVEFMEVKENIISVESYREGIYDYLPEGIFHPPSHKHSRTNIVDVVDQIRQQRQVEQKARSFFQPFEMEVYFSHLKALELAASFDGLDPSNQYLQVLEELWPLLKLLDTANARIFSFLLPYFHQARGKKEWIAKSLSRCFKIPVAISFVPNRIAAIEDRSTVLGVMQMGLTSVLTEDHFDGEKSWLFRYGPIDYADLHLYLEGTPLRLLLQAIYDYCLPVTATVIERFITQKNQHSFRLENNNNSLLGYSTYL
ncbi:type VI secretion system baseplate subunit TssG [Myroides sp. DF42-4-2]|uniref:type VI secretion system baseplate subunit TssG n=1 Tax=unclassified Myroides TaxID=2642485 RepID=UPI002574D0A0|nr:type VI secretion system baseplate subunit TssG [Myroides sp. DF42-4-2]MDM1406956.1 type VI secretion system baseplate subunit TssG [Myroides sp. DF42-4-2]